MAEKTLFPTFDMPEIVSGETTDTIVKYGRSWNFDFDAGEFVTDGGNRVQEADGYNAWVQWCIKTCLTERFSFLAYSSAIGVESEEARQQPSRKATESVLERSISEALLADPRTESVRGFSFSWAGDSVYASFVAYPKIGSPAELQVKISQ